MLFTLCVAALQGCYIYHSLRHGAAWPILAGLLLPIPLYLAGKITGRRTIAGVLLWAAALLVVDWGWIANANPYSPGFRLHGNLFLMAMCGFAMLLPFLLSWIDDGKILPAWPKAFDWYARFFFLACISLLVTGAFFLFVNLGAEMLQRVGIDPLFGFVDLNDFSFVSNFAVAGTTAYWASRQDRLMEALRRYLLPILSCLLPMMSLFSLAFFAALPTGVEALWERGFDSGLVLFIYAVTFLLVFAALQGGFRDDGELREPFPRWLNGFVKCSVALLPIYGALLVYTIGLRVRQYSWTVDRASSVLAAALLLLWTAAWSAALIWKWAQWPRSYGRIDRIAFPLAGIVLILLASPLCDMRRIVLAQRTALLYNMAADSPERIADDFDWRYLVKNLGIYGVRFAEELGTEAGEKKFRDRLVTALEDEAALETEILARAAEALEDIKSGSDATSRLYEDIEAGREKRKATIRQAFLTMPAVGGTLSPEDREVIANMIWESFARWFFENDPDAFLLFQDLNGDGKDEIFLCVGEKVVMVETGDRETMALELDKANRTRIHAPDALDRARSGDYGAADDPWKLLRIGGSYYAVPRHFFRRGL